MASVGGMSRLSTEFVNGLVTALGGLFGVVLFVMPGYVVTATLDRGAREPELSDLQFTVRSAIGGVVVHLLLSFWTIPLIDGLIRYWDKHGGLDFQHYFFVFAWVTVVLLAAPLIVGFGLRLAAGQPMDHLAYRIVSKFGIDRASPAEDALAFALDQRPTTGNYRWAHLYLATGSEYFATFTNDSLLGNAPGRRDLYFANAWYADSAGRPAPGESFAIWIKEDQIASIEFFDE